MEKKSPAKSRLDRILQIPEMNIKGKKKDYPSINDYYKAASRGDKPIQYQHGLSNYSNVLLGDDRVSFKKSLSQDAYSLDDFGQDGQDKEVQENTQCQLKSYKQRQEDYAEANEAVGIHKIHEMEQMMRDKLQQRTKTGPFQLRKTFKYFDRDGSGGIDFSEFQRAMELMGFQFTEVQQLALFARYDESCTGEVDYNDFVEKVMESDFKVVHKAAMKKNLDTMISSAFSPNENAYNNHSGCHNIDDEISETEEDEREQFRRREVKKMFDLVDKDSSGYIDRKELQTLMKSLNKNFSNTEITEGFARVDTDLSGRIEFNEFYEWYRNIYCVGSKEGAT